MDILAHALWAGVGVAALRTRFRWRTRIVVTTVALAALPDLLHLLPILCWWALGDGSAAALWAYVVALPGQEPALPPSVGLWSHHLHCVAHSGLVAAAVTMAWWLLSRTLWVPLLGWWMHIVIDVFTHSADYYASPVLYPLTERGFDGIAWNTPWFLLLNYIVLAAVGLGLWFSRDRLTA